MSKDGTPSNDNVRQHFDEVAGRREAAHVRAIEERLAAREAAMRPPVLTPAEKAVERQRMEALKKLYMQQQPKAVTRPKMNLVPRDRDRERGD